MSESLYDVQNFGIEDLNSWAHPGGGTETVEIPSGQGLVEDQFEAHLQGLHIAYKEPLAHALASLANKLDEDRKEKVASQVDSIIQKLAEDTRLAELANMLNNIGAFFERHYSMVESAKAIVPDERMADFQKLVATNGAAIQKLVLHFNKLKSGFNEFKTMESIPDEHYVQYKNALDKIQTVARGLENNVRAFLKILNPVRASLDEKLIAEGQDDGSAILNKMRKAILNASKLFDSASFGFLDFTPQRWLFDQNIYRAAKENLAEIQILLHEDPPDIEASINLAKNLLPEINVEIWQGAAPIGKMPKMQYNLGHLSWPGNNKELFLVNLRQLVKYGEQLLGGLQANPPPDAREKQEPQQFTNPRDQELIFDLMETIQAIEQQAKLHQMRGNSIATTMSDEDGKRFEQLVRNDIAKNKPTLSRLKHVQMQVEQLKKGNSLPYEVYADYTMALSQIRSAVDKMVANLDVFAKQVQLEKKM